MTSDRKTAILVGVLFIIGTVAGSPEMPSRQEDHDHPH